MSLNRCARGSARGGGQFAKSSSDYLAYALLDSIIDHYYPVLELVGTKIDQIEDDLVENPLARSGGGTAGRQTHADPDPALGLAAARCRQFASARRNRTR